MTDKDIIEKVASLWSSRVQVMRKRPNRKQAWVTRIFGHKAMAWMKVLKPLMGTRRQQKIAAVIEKGYSPMSHREKGSKGMKVRMTAHYARLNNLNRNLFEA